MATPTEAAFCPLGVIGNAVVIQCAIGVIHLVASHGAHNETVLNLLFSDIKRSEKNIVFIAHRVTS